MHPECTDHIIQACLRLYNYRPVSEKLCCELCARFRDKKGAVVPRHIKHKPLFRAILVAPTPEAEGICSAWCHAYSVEQPSLPIAVALCKHLAARIYGLTTVGTLDNDWSTPFGGNCQARGSLITVGAGFIESKVWSVERVNFGQAFLMQMKM